MRDNNRLGSLIAVGGILTALLIMFVMASIYNPVIEGKILDGRPDEAITVRIVYALLGWLGIMAGAVWGVVFYGFQNKKKFAWSLGLVAATIQILVGFFPMIPAASIGLPTPTIWVFIIAFVWWFGMLFIGGVERKVIFLAFISGLAYVLTFIDGVGAISRLQTETDSFPNGMYAMAQMVNWWGAIAWAVFIYALARRKSWAIYVGIFAPLMSMLGGFPVGITDVFQIGRFSMFLPAPIMSTLLLIFFLTPSGKNILAPNID